MLRGGTPSENRAPRINTIPAVDEDDDTGDTIDIFKMDKEITNQSQQKKSSVEECEHLLHLRQWIKNLPDAKPTRTFGDFRLDVEAIMNAVQTQQTTRT